MFRTNTKLSKYASNKQIGIKQYYQHLLIFKWRDLNAVSKKKSSRFLMKRKARQLTFFPVLCNVIEMSQIQYCWGWLWYNYSDVSTYFFWKMASKLTSNLEYLLYPELLSRDRISCLFLSNSYWKQSTQSSGFIGDIWSSWNPVSDTKRL